MNEFEIHFKDSALRELESLRRQIVRLIFPRIQALALDPRPAGCRKLHGGVNHWRIRAGQYRVIYTIDDRKRIVVFMLIRNRKDAYD